VDEVLALEPAAESAEQVRRSVPELAAQMTRLQHAMLARVAELNARKVPAELGFRGTSQFLQALLSCTARTAKGLALAVQRFGPRRSLTGQALQPVFPIAAEAWATGVISQDHATVIADAICALPEPVRVKHWAEVKLTLVELACTKDPGSVGLLAQRIAAHLDPDGPTPETDQRAQSRRRLQVMRFGDSSAELSGIGILTPACQAIWETILTSLAAKPATDALGQDTRTDAQRLHDAFEHAGKLLLKSGRLPHSAGAPTTLVITVDLKDLERRTGRATTHHGGTLSINDALRLAADANLLPVVLDDAREILAYGRGRRLASPGQRKALMARDRGCTFPDCTRPAAISEIHHTTEWAHGGQTNLSTMAVTCGYHNNEAPRQGWTAHLLNGTPHWTPPRWKSPDQQPIRNYAHFPELLARPIVDEPTDLDGPGAKDRISGKSPDD
jgi:hypothetical protein